MKADDGLSPSQTAPHHDPPVPHAEGPAVAGNPLPPVDGTQMAQPIQGAAGVQGEVGGSTPSPGELLGALSPVSHTPVQPLKSAGSKKQVKVTAMSFGNFLVGSGGEEFVVLCVGTSDGSVVVFDKDFSCVSSASSSQTAPSTLPSLQKRWSVESHGGRSVADLLTVDPFRVISCSPDCTVRVWDVRNGTPFSWTKQGKQTQGTKKAKSSEHRTDKLTAASVSWTTLCLLPRLSGGTVVLGGSTTGQIFSLCLQTGETMQIYGTARSAITALLAPNDEMPIDLVVGTQGGDVVTLKAQWGHAGRRESHFGGDPQGTCDQLCISLRPRNLSAGAGRQLGAPSAASNPLRRISRSL
uniref:Uncharacterized protein n=1 Tax=Chromera velia CCMP2878 TaxID=1169474 RepID=A0A0G4FNL5_9ALVE|eukprot:Cvel_17885.t1-p1 / transcript=Cvel_17885.t1 / gene=Cvel_17885 / organism=Chromera_velia_CCMP2878 / gene_product=hypothetical protein / transcript_product=hypothetical protein / location=Cvel_scaffold1451:17191-18249(-) / protein_length=353 / sequence_SO=supercontig / SO=protein_coding / is_pseudo=false